MGVTSGRRAAWGGYYLGSRYNIKGQCNASMGVQDLFITERKCSSSTQTSGFSPLWSSPAALHDSVSGETPIASKGLLRMFVSTFAAIRTLFPYNNVGIIILRQFPLRSQPRFPEGVATEGRNTSSEVERLRCTACRNNLIIGA
ncbi:Hypothetical protein NTJ_15634 [Nesidiocoris tenuis]|uniref:Uncharacterized protein n=1 Tax=Nesidiocoris tenuis TaxID=355587 RepID=A0ABN7BEM2_9HEMI|nr:Hypothetical protein NTJ_15634 [Nesidiocoris tenuis]